MVVVDTIEQAFIQVNLSALQHNIRAIQIFSQAQPIIWMLKCNAYGHGAIEVARCIPESDTIAVVRMSECLDLIHAGIAPHRILLMSGFNRPEDCQRLAALGCQCVIHSEHQLSMLSKTLCRQFSKIWLKVNTGMHRLGLSMQSISSVVDYLQQLAVPQNELCLMTHLACAEDPTSEVTKKQLAHFRDCAASFDWACCSAFNSDGMIHHHSDLPHCIRPGLALYGVGEYLGLDLRPVMRVMAPVIAMQAIKLGSTVGYGATWQAQRDTRLAVVAFGYGDGYPRECETASLGYAGQSYAVVGRVSMDYLTVDVTDCPNIDIGDWMEVWGATVCVAGLANKANTISYTLLTRVSGRLSRDYIFSEER